MLSGERMCAQLAVSERKNDTQGHKPGHISELAQSVFAQPKDEPQMGDVVPGRSQNLA